MKKKYKVKTKSKKQKKKIITTKDADKKEGPQIDKCDKSVEEDKVSRKSLVPNSKKEFNAESDMSLARSDKEDKVSRKSFVTVSKKEKKKMMKTEDAVKKQGPKTDQVDNTKEEDKVLRTAPVRFHQRLLNLFCCFKNQDSVD